ncbi:hypothetical protein [Actinomadura alba]
MRVLLALAATLGLLGGACAGEAPGPGTRGCPQACTMIYEPVNCRFANGTTMTFGNRCVADAYACRHRLRIVGCGAKAD